MCVYVCVRVFNKTFRIFAILSSSSNYIDPHIAFRINCINVSTSVSHRIHRSHPILLNAFLCLCSQAIAVVYSALHRHYYVTPVNRFLIVLSASRIN